VGTTGARSRRGNAPARGKHTLNRGQENTRPANRAAFELFSIDSITGGGSKKIGERYYQVEAVTAICSGLADGGRGQLRAACGTGKTVMAQRAAELLCANGGLVVILCPSIALVAQTLQEWEATTENYIALAACSDDTVRDAVVTIDAIPAAVTTDTDDIVHWLKADSGSRLRLIVGTHVSAHVVGDALRQLGKAADLLVVDEAHRTAGIVDKHTALVHDDDRFPAVRRLYATATPKVVGERGRDNKHAVTRIAGMDDYTVFGPILYEYSFAQAIDDGYLDDYQLVVMGVTRDEIIEHLKGLPRSATGGGWHTSLHTAMVQTVLAKAAHQYGFRRALTFCRRLNEAQDFARTMRETLAALPVDMKPDVPLTTGYVHGGMSTTEREKRLQLLKEPPADGWSVVTNVRCLAEGVDVPAIDAVAFTHPKQSIAEIVQAIGRALRPDPNGSGMATIVVPILLPNSADDVDELDEFDIRDYRLLWQVVKALRAHDERIGAPLDREHLASPGAYSYSEEQPLEHVIIRLPAGYDDGSFLHQLTAKIVATTRVAWWDSYAALKEFHHEHGHAAVPRDYVVQHEATGEGIKLGVWADTVRANHRKGLLEPDKVRALEEIGFDFLPRAVEWAEGLRAAAAYYEQHGHLEPVRTLKINGIELRPWLDKQRDRAAAGDLDPSRRAALTALRMRWHGRPKTFDEYCAALAGYRDQHGHINVDPDPVTEDGHLGNWLVTMRIRRKMEKLTEDEIVALDALGMEWIGKPAPTDAFRSTGKAARKTGPRQPSEQDPARRPTAPQAPPKNKPSRTASPRPSAAHVVVSNTPLAPSPPPKRPRDQPGTSRTRAVKPPVPLFQQPTI
jgi:superfamily II DNA or RNA helicase